MFVRMRFVAMVAASVALHLIVVMLASGSSSTGSLIRSNGQAPVFVLEVSINPPELPAVPAASKSELPKHSVTEPTASTSAPKLLTLPPSPSISRQGTAANNPKPGIYGAPYFPTSSLTKRPRPISEPSVQLPQGWLEASGQTVLTLYVNADGTVDDVLIGRNNLAPELHDSVMTAFKNLKFNPGEINGLAVPVVMTIEADLSATLQSRR